MVNVKKFKLDNSENKSIHKTAPGTNPKERVISKRVKFEGICSNCQTKAAIVIKVMMNPNGPGVATGVSPCPVCQSNIVMKGSV